MNRGVRGERYSGVVVMTEGKGYCARRQERRGLKRLRDLVENKDDVVIIPDDATREARKRRAMLSRPE